MEQRIANATLDLMFLASMLTLFSLVVAGSVILR